MTQPVYPPDGESALKPGLSRSVTLVMAVSTGAAVANIYYNQPMLDVIARDFGGHPGMIGLIPTATQIGYAAGLVFLVPLGDIMERRRLIVLQFAGLIAALALAALAPGAASLALASVLIGMAASAAQQIVPFAAALASPEKRGAVVGTVMSGLLCGILLGRVLSGAIAASFGWRAMFWLGAGIALIVGILLRAVLPEGRSHSCTKYHRLIASLGTLWRTEPVLRRATFVQAGLFGSFSVFWSVLALRLAAPPFHMGSAVAGTFGLVGAAGVLAAPIAGRIADRRGPVLMIGLGTGLVLITWAVFSAWTGLGGLILGVILLDLGAQATLISNQHRIYALRPEARSRINTVFMALMFAGGAFGSAGGAFAWAWGGWPLVCLLGATLPALALAAHLLSLTPRREHPGEAIPSECET